MKYYYAFFRDNNTSVDPDGHLYKVVVKTKKGEGTEELLLSGSPFVVEYESEGLYKAYKCSTATIGLLNKDYNKDFICDSITDNEVYLYRLKDSEHYIDDLKWEASDKTFFTLEWCGYTTTNAYSQGYNSYMDEFQLECQDRLSIMKYYRYDSISISNQSQKNLFFILFEMIVKLGLKSVYVTKSLHIPNDDDNSDQSFFASKIYFLSSTFYENNESMYIADILDNILSYLSLTLIQVKDSLYLVNYNAIAYGFSEYLCVGIDGTLSTKTVERNYIIDKDDSASNDTNLSIIESYDDFVIDTELDIIDRGLDEVDWYNKTPSQFNDELYSQCNGRIIYYSDPIKLMKIAEWDKYSIFQQYSKTKVHGYTSIQFYSFSENKKNYYSPDIKFYGYEIDKSITKNGIVAGDIDTSFVAGQCQLVDMTYGKSIREHVSAFPISYGLIQDEDYQKQLDVEHTDGLFICAPLVNAQSMTDDEWYSVITSNSTYYQQPMIDIVYEDVSITREHPLCWKTDVEYFPDYIPCLFKPMTSIDKLFETFFMSVIIETGSETLYYNDNGKWQKVRCLCRIHIDGIEYEGDQFGKSYKLNNNSSNRFGVKKYDNGVVISSDGKNYTGRLTIRIYRQFGVSREYSKITTSTLLTNIELVELDTRNTEIVPADEVVYAYKDTNRYINEQYSESMKYNTYTGKSNVSNQVYEKNRDGTLKPLDYILDITAGDVFRPEEQRLRDCVKQMSSPTFSLESTGHCDVDMITKVQYNRFRDAKFVVNGLTIDYVYDRRTYNIVEKK